MATSTYTRQILAATLAAGGPSRPPRLPNCPFKAPSLRQSAYWLCETRTDLSAPRPGHLKCDCPLADPLRTAGPGVVIGMGRPSWPRIRALPPLPL